MMRFPVTSLVLLSLTACTLGPDYHSPDLSSLKTPADWQNANATQPTDLTTWWKNLHDPSLEALISKALQQNPDLKIAASRLRQARAQRTVSRAGTWPTLEASGSARSGGSGSATSDSYQAGFDASWELDLWGAQRRSNEAAEATYAAEVASAADTRVSLLAEVAATYTELRNSQRRLNIATRNLASQRETLAFIEMRHRAGLVDSLTLDQARASTAQTAAQLPALETSVMTASYTLATLLGEAPGTTAQLLNEPDTLPALPEALTLAFPAETLRQRPDVQVAERNLAAATAKIGVAEAAMYPSLSLSGTLGLSALSPTGILNAATLTQSVASSLAVSLFDAGRLRAQLAIQTEAQEQAFQTYQKTILAALQEVESDLYSLKRVKERITELGKAARSAASAAQLASSQYRAGLADYQTVLEAERTRLNAEDSLASAEADQLTTLIALYKALGGGWNQGEPHE